METYLTTIKRNTGKVEPMYINAASIREALAYLTTVKMIAAEKILSLIHVTTTTTQKRTLGQQNKKTVVGRKRRRNRKSFT